MNNVCKAPALANTPASASQQAAQLRPRAAPPAECYDGKSISKVKPSNKKGEALQIAQQIHKKGCIYGYVLKVVRLIHKKGCIYGYVVEV